MLNDLHRVLNEEVHNQHNIYMEWIIIWLMVAYLITEFYDVLVNEWGIGPEI